eukprot:scaffold82432_cov77-Cyclotella_meneghiniana.AAC.2
MPSANLSAVVPAASPDPILFAVSCLLLVLGVMGIALDAVPAVCALGQLPGGRLGPCESIRIGVQMSHLGLRSMGIGYYVPHDETSVFLLGAILPASSMGWNGTGRSSLHSSAPLSHSTFCTSILLASSPGWSFSSVCPRTW